MSEHPKLIDRLLRKWLRRTSPEYRAWTELFERPYSDWVAWNSGLGDALHVLYALAVATKPGVIVEIGSARGKSTCALALACRQNAVGKVYAIDPHSDNEWTDRGVRGGSEEFLRRQLNEYGLQGLVEIIKATSDTAARQWNQPIDFLFIDGDHSYRGVKADFESFRPWLTADALVAFHDTAWDHRVPWESQPASKQYHAEMGVPAFMEELRLEGYHSVTVAHEPGLTILYPRPGGFAFLAGRSPKST